MKLQELLNKIEDKRIRVELLSTSNAVLNKCAAHYLNMENYPEQLESEVLSIDIDRDTLIIRIEYERHY